MRSHARNWLLPVVGLILITGSSTCSYGQRDEEYKVYDTVIRHMFAGGITRFDMSAKVDSIVIRDRTNSEYAYGAEREPWDRVKNRLKLLNEEIIADYESRRKSEKELKSLFEIPIEYSLISNEQLKKVFPDPNNFDRTNQSWTEFYKLYPNSAGYNSLSRVGFDKEKRRALVYFVNWCGGLCGTGSYLVLEKVGSKWKVQESAGIWIS